MNSTSPRLHAEDLSGFRVSLTLCNKQLAFYAPQHKFCTQTTMKGLLLPDLPGFGFSNFTRLRELSEYGELQHSRMVPAQDSLSCGLESSGSQILCAAPPYRRVRLASMPSQRQSQTIQITGGATLCTPAHPSLCLGAPNHKLPAGTASRAPGRYRFAHAALSISALHCGTVTASVARTAKTQPGSIRTNVGPQVRLNLP